MLYASYDLPLDTLACRWEWVLGDDGFEDGSFLRVSYGYFVGVLNGIGHFPIYCS